MEWAGRIGYQRHDKILWDNGTVLYVDCGVYLVTYILVVQAIYFYQKIKHALKRMNFIRCKLYVN